MFCSIHILFLSQNFASQSILLKSLQLNILGGVLFHERGGGVGELKSSYRATRVWRKIKSSGFDDLCLRPQFNARVRFNIREGIAAVKFMALGF